MDDTSDESDPSELLDTDEFELLNTDDLMSPELIGTFCDTPMRYAYDSQMDQRFNHSFVKNEVLATNMSSEQMNTGVNFIALSPDDPVPPSCDRKEQPMPVPTDEFMAPTPDTPLSVKSDVSQYEPATPFTPCYDELSSPVAWVPQTPERVPLWNDTNYDIGLSKTDNKHFPINPTQHQRATSTIVKYSSQTPQESFPNRNIVRKDRQDHTMVNKKNPQSTDLNDVPLYAEVAEAARKCEETGNTHALTLLQVKYTIQGKRNAKGLPIELGERSRQQQTEDTEQLSAEDLVKRDQKRQANKRSARRYRRKKTDEKQDSISIQALIAEENARLTSKIERLTQEKEMMMSMLGMDNEILNCYISQHTRQLNTTHPNI